MEVSRHVDVSVETVESHLTPEVIIMNEGTFSVSDVDDSDGEIVVTATAPAITATFRFERLNNGYYYEQEGTEGPFEEMATTISFAPSDGGTTITMTSDVSLGMRPNFLFDRIAGWKRRGELRRALRNLVLELQ